MPHALASEAIEAACRMLDRLFIEATASADSLDHNSLVRLLYVRKWTFERQDRHFDQVLLDAGRACDERARDGMADHLTQLFNFLIGFFGKVEVALGHISRLAFMDSEHLNVDLLLELKKDQTIFDTIETGLFSRLFVDELLENPLLGSYGRRRIKSLVQGIESAGPTQDVAAIEKIIFRLRLLEKEERLFMWLLDIIRARMGEQHMSYLSPEGREVLSRLATLELRHRRLLEGELPVTLFLRALDTIKKEAIYLNAVLPRIMQGDRGIRAEFVREAGLDLFYIEDIEERFCREQGLDRGLPARLRGAA